MATVYTMSGEPQKARVDIVNADCPCKSEIVLELVMSYLPTKDCVRTSILSSRWRYRWTTIPSLVFDTTCCPRSCEFGSVEEGKAPANIINRFLSLHNGAIQVFKFRGPCVAPDIDCWILRVSKDSIKTLVLELRCTMLYKLHSSLFTCGSLSSLKLEHCLLSPPSSFEGFKNLKCLELERVTLANDALEKLVSSCPLLEKLVLSVLGEWRGVRCQLPSSLFNCGSLSSLKLENCSLRLPLSFKGSNNLKCLELECFTLTNDSFEKLISSCPLLEKLSLINLKEANDLKINAPNLRHIHIVGDFVSINFGYAMTRLAVIYIDAPECSYASLLDSFIKFPNIQEIELRRCHMGVEHMSGHSILEGIPFKCKDLYHLAISMNFRFSDYGGATLYLYRGSSNLTRKQTVGRGNFYLAVELGVWEDNGKRSHEFEKLRSVRIDNFCGEMVYLKFAKFVLAISPVLEEMTVNPQSDGITWRNIKRIYEFERASTRAEIKFDGCVSQIC